MRLVDYSLFLGTVITIFILWNIGNQDTKQVNASVEQVSPETYRLASNMYRNMRNDDYARFYYTSDREIQNTMLKAADDNCDGKLYEDFSCKEGK